MTIRFASALFALALPLVAQNPAPAAAEADNLFYKAFYLQHHNDLAGAMDLFQKFLDAAPDSKLAPEAASLQVAMLDKTGKSKERDAFKEKYAKQLAAAPKAPPPGDRAGGDNGERPQPGAGGDRPRGQGRGGMAGARVLYGDKKIADMSAEEITQVKESLANSSRMVDMMKQNGQEEQAKKFETAADALKKALDANKTEDAQKALEQLREARPARGRGQGGGGGGNNGGGNNGGGNNGGGNNGGGGGGQGGKGGN